MSNIEHAPKAYRLYLNQFSERLINAESLVKGSADANDELLSAARIDFHTLKGGAGFFGLSQIAETAGRLEELFGDTTPNNIKKNPDIEALLDGLYTLAKSLPIAEEPAPLIEMPNVTSPNRSK